MTEEEMKIIASTPIKMNCFEMGDFSNCGCAELVRHWRRTIEVAEDLRRTFNKTKDERYLKELIRLLPNSYKAITEKNSEVEELKAQLQEREKIQELDDKIVQELRNQNADLEYKLKCRDDELAEAKAMMREMKSDIRDLAENKFSYVSKETCKNILDKWSWIK